MNAYPPEPWLLRGQLHVTVWRVDAAALPALPARLRPIRLGATALVATAWVHYEPGGVLAYRELLAAVLAQHGRWPLVSITDIWVDSEASLRGGRELWGIPKDLADFDVEHAGPSQHWTATTSDGAAIARGTVTARTALPGRWPAGYTVAQQLAGQLVLTPMRSRSALQPTRSTWEFTSGGPLGWIRGAHPLRSGSLRDFELRVGPRRPC
ncbi:MAG: acetoacetate decarboxylase [Pseudonocardiaceae bacterium]|nr:acetoacetate decarboxylase [Pseudonocardiaceae bacterium]